MKECLDSGWISTGKYTSLFQSKIAKYTKSKYAVACVNGTSALQLSLRLSGVRFRDEVIVPSMTHTATAHAVEYTGAKAVFADVHNFAGNLDLNTAAGYDTVGTADDILDFTERNPFGEIDE